MSPNELNNVLQNIPPPPEAFFKVVYLSLQHQTNHPELRIGDTVAYMPRSSFYRKVEKDRHNGKSYALDANNLEFIGYKGIFL